jgi:two-component system, OmpR family, KDP operon response regulator KdpE
MNSGIGCTRVLIVDGESHARRLLSSALATLGFETGEALTAEEALPRLRRGAADVVLLHSNTPGNGGVADCRVIRASSEVPLIVVAGRPVEREKIETLDAGADDFVIKPFEMDELAARIRAVTRRVRVPKPRVALDGVEIDLQSRDVIRNGVASHLTGKEFKLVEYLLSRAGEVVPHGQLLAAIWGPEHGDEIEYLRVLINQLRKKIEPEPGKPRYLLTEPHTGYRFRLSVPEHAGGGEN